jgi:hypothetical protein
MTQKQSDTTHWFPNNEEGHSNNLGLQTNQGDENIFITSFLHPHALLPLESSPLLHSTKQRH